MPRFVASLVVVAMIGLVGPRPAQAQALPETSLAPASLSLRQLASSVTFDTASPRFEVPAAETAAMAQGGGVSPTLIKLFLMASLKLNNYRAFDMDILGEVGKFELGHPSSPDLAPGLGLRTSEAAQSVGVSTNWSGSYIAGLSVTTFSYGSTLGLSGGVRFKKQTADQKYVIYAQGQAGIQHGGGDTAFQFVPGAGIIIPLENKKFSAVAGLDLPIVFYTGDTEVWFNIYGGISIPVGGK